MRARFDLGRGCPAAAAAASAACRSRRFDAGTHVLFTCVAQSKSRLLQQVRHRWNWQSFFAWFPHSWHAVDPWPITFGSGAPCCCCCGATRCCFPASATPPHSNHPQSQHFIMNHYSQQLRTFSALNQ
jgi:hypothetical protein